MGLRMRKAEDVLAFLWYLCNPQISGLDGIIIQLPLIKVKARCLCLISTINSLLHNGPAQEPIIPPSHQAIDPEPIRHATVRKKICQEHTSRQRHRASPTASARKRETQLPKTFNVILPQIYVQTFYNWKAKRAMERSRFIQMKKKIVV